MHHFANTQQCRNNFPCRHMRSVIPCQQKRTFWDNHFSSPSTPGAEGKAPPRNRVWNQIDERIGNTTFTFSKIVFLHNMTGLHGNCWNYVPESYTYSKPLQYVQLFGQFMICDRLAPGNLEIINYWIWMKRAQPITLGGSNSKAKTENYLACNWHRPICGFLAHTQPRLCLNLLAWVILMTQLFSILIRVFICPIQMLAPQVRKNHLWVKTPDIYHLHKMVQLRIPSLSASGNLSAYNIIEKPIFHLLYMLDWISFAL